MRDGSVLVMVPPGTAEIGDGAGSPDERPIHEVELSAFSLGKTEVTAAQYARFLAFVRSKTDGDHSLCHESEPAGKSHVPGPIGPDIAWSADGAPPQGYEDRPVIFVDWFDAYAYCAWAGGTLPTEAEWERAAALGAPGTARRRFPWGDRYEGGRAQLADAASGKSFADEQAYFDWRDQALAEKPLLAVAGATPGDRSPLGLLDMAGNVREWCLDFYDRDFYAKSPRENPANARPGRGRRAIRGGSWLAYPENARASFRDSADPGVRMPDTGFRLCIRAKR